MIDEHSNTGATACVDTVTGQGVQSAKVPRFDAVTVPDARPSGFGEQPVVTTPIRQVANPIATQVVTRDENILNLLARAAASYAR